MIIGRRCACTCVRVCVCVRERARERELRALIGLGWFWKAVGNCRINVSYLTVVYVYSLFTDGSVMCSSEINFTRDCLIAVYFASCATSHAPLD